MSLDERARDVWAEVSQQVASIERPSAGVIARRSRRGRMATGLAAIAVLALAGVGLAAARRDDSASTGLKFTDNPELTTVPDDPEFTTVLGPGTNGWVAFDSRPHPGQLGADIYLVRPGEDAHLMEVAGSDTTNEVCPTWSPDGTRLMFGRVTASENTTVSDPELVIVPVGRDGAAGDPTVIALDDSIEYPCAIWAPDGRWVAFGDPYGAGAVSVVDTQTGKIRRLPDLRPIDLEWRPGTDQLTMTGDLGPDRASDSYPTPITVYSVSTGEFHQLGSVEAGGLAWSPDGSSLAYSAGGDQSGLWLVDADGANERVLDADPGSANHGVGPVWSPTGDRIAYQRLCCGGMETHEVVLVRVADGSQTVIAPPQTDGPNGSLRWYPWTVTWSPDGTTLLYTAWSTAPGPSEQQGVIAVPADMPSDLTVLDDTHLAEHHQGVLIQNWGRQPG